MMEKEFLPYELALKLKELGFNDECLGYYEGKTLCFATDDSSFGGLYFIENHHTHESPTAPLWQQAFYWFRNKGYDSFVKELYVDTLRRGYYYGIDKYKGISIHTYKTPNPTYEEARLECLKQLIKIIE